MGRVLKKLMVLIVAIASSVAALAQTAQVGNVYYLFSSEDKTATVVANRNEWGSILPNSYSGDVTIPSTVVYGGQTYNVTAISEKAFSACAITSIHIPASVASIGTDAFGSCTELKRVYIEDLAKWCETQFANPEANPLSQANHLYLKGQLLTGAVVIPDDVVRISNYAFWGCADMTELTIGKAVKAVGAGAFYYCRSLRKVNWNARNSGASGDPDRNTPIFKYDDPISEIVFGDEVESIPNYCCYRLSNLRTATLGRSVRTIGIRAFEDCKSLLSVNVPASLTTMYMDAFQRCTSLEAVHIESLSGWLGITFGSEVSNPLTYAHHLYVDGKEVVDLVLPSAGRSINDYAFNGATALRSVTIPATVNTIKQSFMGCIGLAVVRLPETIKTIYPNSFSGCESLEEVYCPVADPAKINVSYFTDTPIQNCRLYVPQGTGELYASKAPWNSFGSIIEALDPPIWPAGALLGIFPHAAQIPLGSTLQLSVAPSSAIVQWQSANPEIVQVDSTGMAHALQYGVTDVTITDEAGNKAVCTILVYGDMDGDKKISIGDVNVLLQSILETSK